MQFFFLRPKTERDEGFLFILFIFLFTILSPFFVQAEESMWRENLLRLLPSKSRSQGWKLDTPPETAEGLELYSLINGGAEIYVQAGFKRAVMASYRDPKGKMINLEIFEMTSAESARNVHAKKISKEGKGRHRI